MKVFLQTQSNRYSGEAKEVAYYFSPIQSDLEFHLQLFHYGDPSKFHIHQASQYKAETFNNCTVSDRNEQPGGGYSRSTETYTSRFHHNQTLTDIMQKM